MLSPATEPRTGTTAQALEARGLTKVFRVGRADKRVTAVNGVDPLARPKAVEAALFSSVRAASSSALSM